MNSKSQRGLVPNLIKVSGWKNASHRESISKGIYTTAPPKSKLNPVNSSFKAK